MSIPSAGFGISSQVPLTPSTASSNASSLSKMGGSVSSDHAAAIISAFSSASSSGAHVADVSLDSVVPPVRMTLPCPEEANSGIGDLRTSYVNSKDQSVQIGQTLAEHFMKVGQHEGATGGQINAMSRIANEAFANACGQDHPQLAEAIRASADVEAAIEANNFNAPVTEHFAKHNVLTLSDFGCKGHSVGLNVYKNGDGSYDLVLCNRGLGNQPDGEGKRTFFQVRVPNLEQALSLLNTLRELKQAEGPEGSSGGAPTMVPVYEAMEAAGKCEVLKDVSSESQYTGHCGFLNKQAALKQVCQRVLGNVSVYKNQRQDLFQRITSYVNQSDNADLKAMLREYEELQTITTDLKKPQEVSQHQGPVERIQTAINTLKKHINFTSEMGRVNIHIDRMLTNRNISKLDEAFLQQVKNNIILLKKDDGSSLKINQETFLTNVRNLTEIYNQLQSALVGTIETAVDTINTAVSEMTGDQFGFFKPVIEDIAKNLFTSEAVGGTFAENGAWETSTPTSNVLLLVANSNSVDEMKSHLQMIDTVRELESQLNSADLDSFKTALDGMTEEQFSLCRPLIQETVARLFTSEAVGGTFEGNGAWETSTPTSKVLFRVANSKYLSHSKTHLSHISDIKEFQSELASISDTHYQGLVDHLNEKSISELSMAECRDLKDKINSQIQTVPRNLDGELAPHAQDYDEISTLLNKKIALNDQIDNLKEQNYNKIIEEYNSTKAPHKKLEICERVVSFSSDYPKRALEQFQGFLPKAKQNVVYRKAFNEYSHLIDQFNSSKGEDQQNVRQQIIALCDSVIDAGQSKYGSHVEQFENIKSQLKT